MNQVINTMKNHTSIRCYKKRLINKDTTNTIIRSAQMASTSSHFQSYTIIEVQDKAKRKILFEASGEQRWLIKAPLVLLFCGDLHRGNKYFENVDNDVFRNTESYTVAVIDVALAAQNAILSAESMGIGGVIVGGIRNDIELICKEFQLPEMVFPLFALCLGYPDQAPDTKPRLPQQEIHKIDFYDENSSAQMIKKYDNIISEYYNRRTQGRVKNRWTERCGRLIMDKPRYNVGRYLKKNGLLRD